MRKHNDFGIREILYGRSVLAEPFVIQDNIGGRVNRGIEVNAQKNGLIVRPDIIQCSEFHQYTPYQCPFSCREIQKWSILTYGPDIVLKILVS